MAFPERMKFGLFMGRTIGLGRTRRLRWSGTWS